MNSYFAKIKNLPAVARLKQKSSAGLDRIVNPSWLMQLKQKISIMSEKGKALSFRSLTTHWFYSMSISALIISSRIITELGYSYFDILPSIIIIFLSMVIVWLLKLQFYWYNITAYCMVALLYFISDPTNMLAALSFSLVFTGIQLIVMFVVYLLLLFINVIMALTLVLIMQTVLGLFGLLPSEYIYWAVLIFSILLYFNRRMWTTALLVLLLLGGCYYVIMLQLIQTSWIEFPAIWYDPIWIEWGAAVWVNLICYFIVSCYCTACLSAYFATKLTFFKESKPEPVQVIKQ